VRPTSVANTVFVASLHVIVDMAAAFAEAQRVLRPGGRAVVVSRSRDRYPENDDIAPLLADLPVTPRVDDPDAVVAAAARAGLRLRESRTFGAAGLADSPNAVAGIIEQRAWSNLWNVDGAVWASTVLPIVDRLRALPEPDDPRDRSLAFQLSVFEKPGKP
jgi:SAM-dependent methyltransferase